MPRPAATGCRAVGSGYPTNLPLDDLLDGRAWIAYRYDGEPLAPEHGGPARLLVPPVPLKVLIRRWPG